jgi:hypothetical protein
MKHSPFAFFRKHQRVGMVILTVMAMFAFVFLDQTFRSMGGSAAANQVVVKIKGGNLTQEHLNQLIAQRMIANRFIQAVAQSIMEEDPKDRMIAMGVLEHQFGNDFGNLETQDGLESGVMWSHVMRLEAKRLGMSVNDNMVQSYLTRVTAHRISHERFVEILRSAKLKEKQLFDAFREEILAKMAVNALAPRSNQTPEQYWEYFKRLNVQQNLEIAALPVSEFTKSLNKPSDRELETLFTENKAHFANTPPDYAKPGFRQPTKVRVQYLTTTYDRIEKQVQDGKNKYATPITDKDVVDYYEAKKDPLYVEVDFEEPKTGTGKKETDPLTPLVTPESPDAAKPADPAGSKPAEKPAADKPAADKPAEAKPTDAKPATSEQPKTEAPATDKPAAKTEAKPEAKPADKPVESKTGDSAEKKSCGDDPVTTEKTEVKAEEPKAVEKSTDAKAATDKAAEVPAKPAVKSATDANAEDKPADPKVPAETKPAGDKPAETKPDTAKPDATAPAADAPKAGDTSSKKDDATKPDAKPDFKPLKFKPLTDELKDQIRESLLRTRVVEAIKRLGEEAKTQLEEFQIKFNYGPSLDGNTVFIDLNEDGKVDADEPAVDSSKKLATDDLTKLPAELQDKLNEQVFEMTGSAMKKIGEQLGLEYKSTGLISQRNLDSDASLSTTLGKVADINSNEFSANDSGRIRMELFGTESKFHAKVGVDSETNLYVYWKNEHVKEHVAKFTDQGIKEEVTATWTLLEAYPVAQKRADELVKAAKEKKTLNEAFKGETVSGDKESLPLEVHETGDFSWMATGLPSPNMMQMSQVKLSDVVWTKDVEQEFMQVACEDLEVGGVGYAPNRDHSIIYVMRVINRIGENGQTIPQLQEKFMKEQLFENPQFSAYMPPPPVAQMARGDNFAIGKDWIDSLKHQYQIAWTDDFRNGR